MQALFMNLVPPSSRFFFNRGPKKVLSLSLNVKCDQQTHKKIMSLIMASISRKLSNKVLITIIPMFFAGRQSHKNGAVFCWVRGAFYGFVLWGVEMLWVGFMGVTLLVTQSVVFTDSTGCNSRKPGTWKGGSIMKCF